ncbi:flagellar biosynthetic protein FliO [Microbulbifer harenosus]|uniref:Flagellar protein n=1 Tax=Microbulbifer harenosus TaxID=2576840 RepID=A0ABY2UNM0_9GAMM|nr:MULTISPECIES: flagellar biosynthetic protein FliO [Microbulbifer]QIL89894.1 flagellar biosynthetic protein FliO [Microbulbifer sp. SH-1]TLM79972.1 flagellar biosynthetic protein FliO [Microbulbifer harenosus]
MNTASAAAGESVIGLAMLGKVAGVLIALIALILLCAWLLRRLAPGMGHNSHGPQLKIVASKALGTREKVVVLQVQDQWLLLGVGGGQISHLHTLPAEIPPSEQSTSAPLPDTFAQRLAQAMRQNLRGGSDKP